MRMRGFTLAEVAVVAAIVGILASMATVGVTALSGRAKMQRDADSVEELVRKARNLARSERRCVRLDATAGRLTMMPLTHARGAPPDCAGGVDDAARKQVINLVPAVRLTPTSFFFDRAGGAVAGPKDILVTVTSPGTPPRTFTVRAFIGAGAVVRRG